jgi:hypothetical protein
MPATLDPATALVLIDLQHGITARPTAHSSEQLPGRSVPQVFACCAGLAGDTPGAVRDVCGRAGQCPSAAAFPMRLQNGLRDRLDEWMTDELFGGRGGGDPAGLAVRARPASGRPGFDHTVLSEFRTRVAEHALDGLLKACGKQRTDSTHVIVAVRGLHTIELAGESVRAALAAACPDWLAARRCVGDWARRYGTQSTPGTRRKIVCETSARVAAGTGTKAVSLR